MLTAEIIAIGSELLTPERTDTNGLWLTGRLNELGIEVMLKTIVGDDPSRLEETIRDAVKRSDVVITTGGLGPTEDDLTRSVAARALDRELVYVERLEVELRAKFARMGREMPATNVRQAYIVDGAHVLPNPNGSAVGMRCLVERDGREVFVIVLPGPPRENQPMFNDHVFETLRSATGVTVFRKRVLKVSGLGESALDQVIAPIYTTFDDIRTSILFNRSEVEVHLTAQAADAGSADRRNDELVAMIVEKIGDAVFSTNGEEMEEVVGRLMAERGKTLAVAESCTGGLISQRLTDVAGSSAYFMQAAVTYANDSKIKVLGVAPETIEEHGAVSAETAEAMASGMRLLAGTDYAVSVTGIAGPGGGSEEKPVGTVFIGFADAYTVKSLKIVIPGDRYLVRWRASQAALDYLRRRILKGDAQS